MQISERLRGLRNQRRARLREISASTGLSIGYLSDIERGRVLPSLQTCQKLADCYGIPLTLMFSGVEIKGD